MNVEKTFQSLIQKDTAHDVAVCCIADSKRFARHSQHWLVCLAEQSFYPFLQILQIKFHAQNSILKGEFEVLMREYAQIVFLIFREPWGDYAVECVELCNVLIIIYCRQDRETGRYV